MKDTESNIYGNWWFPSTIVFSILKITFKQRGLVLSLTASLCPHSIPLLFPFVHLVSHHISTVSNKKISNCFFFWISFHFFKCNWFGRRGLLRNLIRVYWNSSIVVQTLYNSQGNRFCKAQYQKSHARISWLVSKLQAIGRCTIFLQLVHAAIINANACKENLTLPLEKN